MSDTAIHLQRLWRRVRGGRSRAVLGLAVGTAGLVLAVVVTWAALAGRAHQVEPADAVVAVLPGATAADEQEPAGTVVTLEEGMRAAAGALPQAWIGVPELDAYRRLLAGGAPVVLGGRFRGMSAAFAEQLRPEHCEQWLRDSLTRAERGAGSTDVLHDLGQQHAIKQIYLLYADWPYSSIEAVYNLTEDQETRLEAKRIWDNLALAEYNEQLLSWERTRDDPAYISRGPRPGIR